MFLFQNEVHQADLHFLPHDRLPRGCLRSRKTYKYALTVLDVASRYKEAEPLTTKELLKSQKHSLIYIHSASTKVAKIIAS